MKLLKNMNQIILKITILSILTISIVACGAGGGKKETSPDQNVSQYQTSGSCPSQMVDGLSLANTYVKLFDQIGLSEGKDLTQAHEAYDTALSYFKVQSCEAVDSERGSIVSMNKSYMDGHLERIYRKLSSARLNSCRRGDLSIEEKTGCAHIEYYMKQRFGN